jgi:N-acetylglucosamine-6-phosphate deacetylase
MSATNRFALTGARIFDGEGWHDDAAVLVNDGKVEAVAAASMLPKGTKTVSAAGAMLAPGFVDLQVNGGGGVLFNAEPTVDGIRAICAAHARFGTTALLATLITATRDTTRRALDAGATAAAAKVPGFLGLHLEGPHLAPSRKGAHDAKLMRPMDGDDVAALLEARARLPVTMTTIAPENVTAAQAETLAQAGVLLSLGHTDTSAATARAYVAKGVSLVTHLYNAMSPLGHREPGLVGAALDAGGLSAGLIADGFHVDAAAIRIALRAKAAPGRIFLVTDAMATIGTDMNSFTLDGRAIHRRGGRLTLDDGTLAGADIDMMASVRFLHKTAGVDLDEALRMASLYPAQAARVGDRKGRIAPGMDADLVEIGMDLHVARTWIDGSMMFAQQATPA